MKHHRTISFLFATLASSSACLLAQTQAPPPVEESSSSSLMARTPIAVPTGPAATSGGAPHALRSMSLFAIAPPAPRSFKLHDLVQIIVRETSRAVSSSELETDKESKIKGGVNAWPDFNLRDLLNLRVNAGRTTNMPQLDLDFSKEFKGEGDYERKDDLTARLTAEVIEVLPNGNLVLEARTNIRTDDEEQTMKVTGICRQDDITAANTILSNQIHDLMIAKEHKGELRKTSEKGIIAKVLETVFAF